MGRLFNLRYRYTDNFIVFNNRKFIGHNKDIYPSHLHVEKANRLDDQANYLDLTFIKGDNNRLYTKLYDKHEDFNFKFLSSNIPYDPSFGVYIWKICKMVHIL